MEFIVWVETRLAGNPRRFQVRACGWIDGLKVEDETGESSGGHARSEHFQQPPYFATFKFVLEIFTKLSSSVLTSPLLPNCS